MEKISHRKIDWGNILQYASYVLTSVAIVACVYSLWINDILTAPKDLLGLSARLIKSSIYISLILLAIGIYTISNYSEKLGLDD